MGGIVTSTRKLPVDRETWYDTERAKLGATPLPYYGSDLDSTQTTTSFRSGGAWTSTLPDDTAVVEAKTQEELFKLGRRDASLYPDVDWDNGHEFFTEKQSLGGHGNHGSYRGRPQSSLKAERDYVYTGPLALDPKLPLSLAGVYPTPPASYASANADGANAISKTIPTNPVANLAQGGAEIVREGIPSLIGATALKAGIGHAKSAGHEFLNLEFGWLPLVSDLRKAAQAILNHKRLLDQLKRDDGRVVRRSYVFPETVSTSRVESTGHIYWPNSLPDFGKSAFSSPSGPLTSIITTRQRRWFRGAYQYHLTPVHSNYSQVVAAAEKAQYLLGLELTPEVLWELAPWSWLSDWVANVGNNISTASRLNEDGLVIRYGYLMVETTVTWERTLRGISTYADGDLGAFTWTSSCIRKQRFRSTPYGFGLNTAGFSAKQWTILGALGLTKAPGVLP